MRLVSRFTLGSLVRPYLYLFTLSGPVSVVSVSAPGVPVGISLGVQAGAGLSFGLGMARGLWLAGWPLLELGVGPVARGR